MIICVCMSVIDSIIDILLFLDEESCVRMRLWQKKPLYIGVFSVPAKERLAKLDMSITSVELTAIDDCDLFSRLQRVPVRKIET